MAILGAGLTGLRAAIELGRLGADYRIFEPRDRAGGLAVTVREQGYAFDVTGHLLHVRDPEIRREVLACMGDDCLTLERRSRIFSHGVYTRYPFQANTHGLPPEVAYACVMGFIEAHRAPPGPAPRTFEQFCHQVFGPGISRHFMVPYNERMWGVPASEITADWCEWAVPRPKLEDVIAGALGLPGRELGYNTSFLYPRDGIGALPRALERECRPVELLRSPRRIDHRGRVLHFADEAVSYDALVSTAPLPALVDLLDDPPAAIRAAAGRLR